MGTRIERSLSSEGTRSMTSGLNAPAGLRRRAVFVRPFLIVRLFAFIHRTLSFRYLNFAKALKTHYTPLVIDWTFLAYGNGAWGEPDTAFGTVRASRPIAKLAAPKKGYSPATEVESVGR